MALRHKDSWIAILPVVMLAQIAIACGGHSNALTETRDSLEPTQLNATQEAKPLDSSQRQRSRDESTLPFSYILNDGSSFTLHPRIAMKLRSREEINYVFSYQSSSVTPFSTQYQEGFSDSQQFADAIYPMHFTAVAPSRAPSDIHVQIAQLESLHDAEKIDCLSIQPSDPDAFTDIIHRILAAGIPVFTVGIRSSGNEFSNFSQVPYTEGRVAASIVIEWAANNGRELRVFAVSSGEPAQSWAQGRMQGFYDRIRDQVPHAEFATTPQDALQVGGGSYDAESSYSDYSALLVENPDLDLILNADIGAHHANRAIVDAGREGKVFTLGWNVSYPQLDAIERGIQIAVFDQRLTEQAGYGAVACAELFANGRILLNSQAPQPIQADQVTAVREQLNKYYGIE